MKPDWPRKEPKAQESCSWWPTGKRKGRRGEKFTGKGETRGNLRPMRKEISVGRNTKDQKPWIRPSFILRGAPIKEKKNTSGTRRRKRFLWEGKHSGKRKKSGKGNRKDVGSWIAGINMFEGRKEPLKQPRRRVGAGKKWTKERKKSEKNL